MSPIKNIYNAIESNRGEEAFEDVFASDEVRIERILSEGHATPPGKYFDQNWHEWVVLLQGEAGLALAGEASEIVLKPGDHLFIPAHQKHRVEWTSSNQKTWWLAVHFKPRE